MKELMNKDADTLRPGVKGNDNGIKKADVMKAPKNSIEANKMIRKAGLK